MGYNLTNKEEQVIRLVVQGKKNKEISSFLCISENTTKTHLKNIYSKLNVSSKAELVSFIFSNNLIQHLFQAWK